MRDVVKSQPAQNAQPVRRRRRRRKNLSLYYLMIFLICGIILFVLSRTVLFRIKTIEVVGNSRYTAQELIDAAGLRIGRNMYNVDLKEAEEDIMDEFIYIDSVSVRRKLPDKMVITVEEASAFACCQYEGSRYATITRSGRYLETEQSSPRAELTQIYGLELVEVERGKSLKCTDEDKLEVLNQLLDAIDEICPGKISYIDITNRADIVMGYGGRIDIEFGSSLDYEYKLRYITAIIQDNLEPDAQGRIIYHSASAGASFITNEDLEQMQEDLEERKEQAQQTQQQQQTQENGENQEE